MSALMLLLAIAWGAEIEVESQVATATVYADRARVMRTVTVDVPKGRSDLIFDGLSIQLVADSLSADGKGTARATLTGIDIITKRGTEDRDERVKKLNDEKLLLNDKIAVQSDAINRINGQIKFLTALKPAAPTELDRDTFLADDAPEQLAQMSANLGEDLRKLYAQRRTANNENRDLREEVARIDRELNQVRSAGNTDFRRVAVGVDAARAGNITVDLSYVVTGANWKPRYDARYQLSTGKVRLEMSGTVSQRTGEDWDGVALTLSTAQPQRGTSPPKLLPFTLRQGSNSNRPGGATSSDKVTAFEFEAKRSEDVPSDGTKRRVYLTGVDLDAEVVHKVVPRRQENAFLVARVDYDGEFALLPGPISAYLGSAYVGQGQMRLTPPGGELDLSFGVDDRVAVKRTRITDIAEDTKPLGNRERRNWAFETEVKNHTGKAIELVVVEQLPATRDAKWEVKPTLTPEAEIPKDGVFEWKLEVAEGATQTLRLQYEVSWPEGEQPILMD